MIGIPDHPKLIRFSEIECCAIAAACKCHWEIIRLFNGLIQENYLKLLPKMFLNSRELGFVPWNYEKDLLVSLAEEEIKRLKSGHAILWCGCSFETHIDNLKKIIKRLGKSKEV